MGIKEVEEGIWLVSFMDYDLGYIDLEEKTLQPLDNPFGPRVLPMCPVRSVTHVSGPDQEVLEPRVGVEPTTCRLRIGCSTTELPRPALFTITSAENYCQFIRENRVLSV